MGPGRAWTMGPGRALALIVGFSSGPKLTFLIKSLVLVGTLPHALFSHKHDFLII